MKAKEVNTHRCGEMFLIKIYFPVDTCIGTLKIYNERTHY